MGPRKRPLPQAGAGPEVRAFAVLARLFAGPATKDELLDAARLAPGGGRSVDERTLRRYLSAARSVGFEVVRTRGRYELVAKPSSDGPQSA